MVAPVTIDGCFGWFHPAPGRRGVVLCSPHGYEEICVHRTWRGLAERLAAAGLPTLRFDYPGTGDSAGDDEEPDRVAAWLGSIRAAVEWMRSSAGVEEVALVGLRLGGTLAAAAAAELGDVHSLALLAAPPTGKAYARELRALALLAPPVDGAPPPPPEWRDDLEAAGFVLTARTLADLARLDLLRLPRPAGRVLLMHRPDAPADARVPARLRELGADVRVEPLAGYADLMRDPHLAVVPDASFALLTAWLADGAEPAAATPAPAAGARLRLPRSLEVSVFFGEGSRLFGVHTLPAAPDPDLPAVLFLNTGSDHHVGCNRMAVPLARRLAERGFSSLRFDIAGLGESPACPGQPSNRLYARESCADVRAALDWLERQGHRRAVAVGLCSGAYLAFHTALDDERLAGQVLVNPLRLDWRGGDWLQAAAREIENRAKYKPTSFYVRKALSADTWRRAVSGEVDLVGIGRALVDRGIARARSRVRGRLRAGAPQESELARGFRRLSERGVETLLVLSRGDASVGELEAHLGSGLETLARLPSARIETLDGADHTLTSRRAREEFAQRLESYLAGFTAPPAERRAGVVPAPVPGPPGG